MMSHVSLIDRIAPWATDWFVSLSPDCSPDRRPRALTRFGRRRSPTFVTIPGRYQHHTVSIDGTVTTSWGIPLVPFRLYKVDDGTGEVTVVSESGRMPTRGARVRVKGRVDDVAVIGGQAVGLHLREEALYVKR